MIETNTESSRPVRKRNPDESKKRILDAAEKAFALRGFDGARLRDIALEAHVHHALLHHYFNDKRGLFQEVVKRGIGRLSSLPALQYRSEATLEQNIEAIVGALYDFFGENRHLLRVIEGGLRDRDAVPFDVATSVLGEQAHGLVDGLVEQLTRAQQRGEIRSDLTPKALLVHGLGTLLSAFLVGRGLSEVLGLAHTEGEGAGLGRKDEMVAFLLEAFRPTALPALKRQA